MPKETLKIADKENFVKNIIVSTKGKQLSYSGTALPVEDIQKLYAPIKNNSFSTIVAVGGGTIMDIAKIIAIALSNKLLNVSQILENPTEFINTKNLIFIPTTCGTGSEATHFAVVYKNKKKYSIANNSIIPTTVILDYTLLINLPKNIRNATVLDAISQAIESIWAKNSTEISREFAKDALKNLISGLKENSEINKIKRFQKGSYFAGKAINISKTTAPHAISYPLSAHFGISHGVAVFLTLPYIAKYNFEQSDCPFFSLLFELFSVNNINDFVLTLKQIMTDLGFKIKLSEYGVSSKEISMLSKESIVPGRSDNNPAEISVNSVAQILTQSL